MRIFFRFTPRKKFEFRDLPVLNIYYLFASWEICIRENTIKKIDCNSGRGLNFIVTQPNSSDPPPDGKYLPIPYSYSL